MKKIILSIFLIFAINFITNAQNFGFHAGLNFSSLDGETLPQSHLQGRRAFYVGFLMEVPLGKFFAIQPEINYSRQGARWTNQTLITGQEFQARLSMNYVTLPVMSKIILGKLNLMAGPSFGFLLQKPSVEAETPLFNNSYNIDKKAFKFFDFGVIIGAEYEIFTDLKIGLRYTKGMSNTFDKNNQSLISAQISEKNNFKNSVLSIGVGIVF